MFGIKRLAAVQLGRRVIHVIMHSNESRNDRVPSQIDDRCSRRRLRPASGCNALNLTVGDDERLIFFCDGSSTVDDSHVIENNRWLIIFHERLYLVRELW